MRDLLFTFVLDYKGGTYISQVVAPAVREAIATWPSVVNWDVIGIQLSSRFERQLRLEISGDDPVALSGMTNVWCISPRLGKSVGTLHIIATVRSRCPMGQARASH
jgi:hypothetical protein